MAFKHVLVATDFSECSESIVEHAVEIAIRSGATLTLMNVFQLPYSYGTPFMGDLMRAPLQEAAHARLSGVLEAIRARVPSATAVVRCGSAWEQILEVAREERADLIVVGSHGRTGVPRALLGSVAEKIVRLSPVPVLTIQGPSLTD